MFLKKQKRVKIKKFFLMINDPGFGMELVKYSVEVITGNI